MSDHFDPRSTTVEACQTLHCDILYLGRSFFAFLSKNFSLQNTKCYAHLSMAFCLKNCYNKRTFMAKKADKKVAKKGSYRAESITVLEGLEPVRRRPGMYSGTAGPDGFHHLIWEIFDNSRDEAMGEFANDIEIVLLPGNAI